MEACKLPEAVTCNVQERPGLVVLTIELEGALAQMPGNLSPSRMWSPYREPLAKFLNKYSVDVSIASVRLLLRTGRTTSQTLLSFQCNGLRRDILSCQGIVTMAACESGSGTAVVQRCPCV